ncbi:MAG: hypothetical protein ABSH41_18615 [Syntrophobacteraceae bacterium]
MRIFINQAADGALGIAGGLGVAPRQLLDTTEIVPMPIMVSS